MGNSCQQQAVDSSATGHNPRPAAVQRLFEAGQRCLGSRHGHYPRLRGVYVVLVRPEIAPNTGAIIRLCANTGCGLHLVEPLGFELSDRLLKRGGLDYHEHADMTIHPDMATGLAALPGRIFGFSSAAPLSYAEVEYRPDDAFVFGAEGRGLATEEQAQIPDGQLLTIPMRPHNRSLNLANAASVVVYEAWRQQGFAGAGASSGPSSDEGAPRQGLTAETLTSEPFDH